MKCGLHFTFGAGEALQTIIDTASFNVYARASVGGEFGPWTFLCGPKGGGLGGGSGTVADRAYALASPMTIDFTGAVTGSVRFDGSTNVTAELALGDGVLTKDDVIELFRKEASTPGGVITQAITAALDDHVKRMHDVSESGPGGGNG